MKSYEIRQAFLDYFEKQGHRIVPSSPVVPLDDPTLLFTNAGMVQFKNRFLGFEKGDYKRAASSQKCIRAGGKHNDLDNVGLTARHQTFFEMLGNFSFGDYFKEEAIYFAWEFFTKTLGLDTKKLYATVYKDDDDAEKLWKKIAPELGNRVLRFGEKDNFWSMGDTGPCGPCSEIHIDRGEHIPGELNGDGDRFMELGNLVFMQYNRDESGQMTPLPKPSVDYGGGLERFSMILQNAESNFETDLFTPLINKVVELSGKKYYSGVQGTPHKVIADHVRALTFALADNATISNEGRGYVLRRILRRAARYGHQLGLNEPFLYKIVQPLVDYMGAYFPEIKAQRGHIELVVKTEEEQFGRCLNIGLELFDDIAEKAVGTGSKVIPGEQVFKLYDTYGFPVDLTEIMAREKGLGIDMNGCEKCFEERKELSKKGSKFQAIICSAGIEIKRDSQIEKFIGYDNEKIDTEVLAGKSIDDKKYEFILFQTPFYAESGGQVGDTGFILADNFKIKVTDTIKINDEHIHIGKLVNGIVPELYTGRVTAEIDSSRRADIQRNHTATHLLHKALRMTLGEHVYQSGSLVAPDRLRFDFSHFKAMTDDELNEVENIVNEKINTDLPVTWENKSFAEAKKMGAMALFGEKYGDDVRIVKTGNFSMELCGGTHVNYTKDIGGFFIISEGAIAAGTRRIEAITGDAFEKFISEQNGYIDKLKRYFDKPIEQIDDSDIAEIKNLQGYIHTRILTKENLASKLADLLDIIKKQEKDKSKSAAKDISQKAKELSPKINIDTDKGNLLGFVVKNKSPKEFMTYFDNFKSVHQNETIVVCSRLNGQYAIASSDYNFAVKVKNTLFESVGAKGGGKPTIRGAMPVDKIETALDSLKKKYSL